MTFYHFINDTQPDDIDFSSSPTTVFIRRNITETTKEDPETGEIKTVFEYDEAQVPKTEYIQNLHDRQEETDEALQELILVTFGGE